MQGNDILETMNTNDQSKGNDIDPKPTTRDPAPTGTADKARMMDRERKRQQARKDDNAEVDQSKGNKCEAG